MPTAAPRRVSGPSQTKARESRPKPRESQRATVVRKRPRRYKPASTTVSTTSKAPDGQVEHVPAIIAFMTVFDRRRLPAPVFKLDVERMRQGWYSDKYFINIARTLAELAAAGYRFGGTAPDLSDIEKDLANVDVGSIEVEMQWYPRRQPSCVVVGVDKAVAVLREATGYFDEGGSFVSTF